MPNRPTEHIEIEPGVALSPDVIKSTKLPFGKLHRGKALAEVPLDYLNWMMAAADVRISTELRSIIAAFLQLPEIQRSLKDQGLPLEPVPIMSSGSRTVVFPLPRNNTVEIRLRKPLESDEIPIVITLLKLLEEVCVTKPVSVKPSTRKPREQKPSPPESTGEHPAE